MFGARNILVQRDRHCEDRLANACRQTDRRALSLSFQASHFVLTSTWCALTSRSPYSRHIVIIQTALLLFEAHCHWSRHIAHSGGTPLEQGSAVVPWVSGVQAARRCDNHGDAPLFVVCLGAGQQIASLCCWLCTLILNTPFVGHTPARAIF